MNNNLTLNAETVGLKSHSTGLEEMTLGAPEVRKRLAVEMATTEVRQPVERQFPLLLRWRNPRELPPPEVYQVPNYINPFDMTSLEVLIATYRLTIPTKTRDKWRWVFPNTGFLKGFEHLGSVFIHATDGLLAYFRVNDSGSLFLGHLSNFVGPVAKEYVWEDDWDFELNRQKVHVFKRADGSIVIIPKDTTMDIHWTKCSRMTKEEHELYARLGNREITLAELLEAEKHLQRNTPALGERVIGKKPKTKRQLLLDSL